jgi:hypothetical protein
MWECFMLSRVGEVILLNFCLNKILTNLFGGIKNIFSKILIRIENKN